MAGTNGTKFPGVREHLARVIGERYGLDVAFEAFPADDVPRDPEAYLRALDELAPGDIVTIFTPDDTHFRVALAAVERGCHVLIAKPLVKTVAEHLELLAAAELPERAGRHGGPQALGSDLRRRPRPHPRSRRLQLLLVVHESAQDAA